MNRAVAAVVLAGLLGAAAPAATAGGPTAASGTTASPAAVSDATGAPARTLQSGLSLEAAAELVQRRYGGRVVRAETREERERTVHRIRLLSDDGRVITVTVDARTGRIE